MVRKKAQEKMDRVVKENKKIVGALGGKFRRWSGLWNEEKDVKGKVRRIKG